MPTLDDAVRIAHRWADPQAGSISSSDMMVVMQALVALPHPDDIVLGDDWAWESDGEGPARLRPDQYIVARAEPETRIATFEGPQAAANARLASCAPALIAHVDAAFKQIATIRRENVGDDPGGPTVYDEPLKTLGAALALPSRRGSR